MDIRTGLLTGNKIRRTSFGFEKIEICEPLPKEKTETKNLSLLLTYDDLIADDWEIYE